MLSIRHVDTCLSCYVRDHCNGESELLIGVSVDRSSRVHHVRAGLAFELRNDTSEKIPDVYTEADLEAAIADCFEGAHPFKAFDSSLEPHSDYDDSESCYAWFRLTWTGEKPEPGPVAELVFWDKEGRTGETHTVPCRESEEPRSRRSATGYGPRIGTRHEVKWAGRWRRVYVANYGNAGTAYIGKPGAWLATVSL